MVAYKIMVSSKQLRIYRWATGWIIIDTMYKYAARVSVRLSIVTTVYGIWMFYTGQWIIQWNFIQVLRTWGGHSMTTITIRIKCLWKKGFNYDLYKPVFLDRKIYWTSIYSLVPSLCLLASHKLADSDYYIYFIIVVLSSMHRLSQFHKCAYF